MGELFRRVRALLDSCYSKANLGWPLLTPTEIQGIAEWARNKWPAPTHLGDPRAWARRAKFRLHVRKVRDCSKELTSGDHVMYPPTTNKRLRGILVWHAVAHGILKRYKIAHTEADVWLLTAELCCPMSLVKNWGVDLVIEYQDHAYVWFCGGWVRMNIRAKKRLQAAELPRA
jgi:hypothetical protein